MKAKLRIFSVVCMLVTMMICSIPAVKAVNTEFIDGTGSQNKYMGNGHSHSYNGYVLADVGRAYCIQASVNYKRNKEYGVLREIYDPAYSWIIFNVADEQDKQACIWMLSGNTVTADNGGDVGYIQGLVDQARREGGIKPADASLSANGNFQYDRATNTYRTTYNASNANNVRMEGAPAGSRVEGNTLIIPAANVEGDMDINVVCDGGGQGWDYHAATVWGDGTNQEVVTGSRDMVTGGGASTSVHLEAVCDIVVVKNDEFKHPVANVTFKITGPHKYQNTLSTDSEGKIKLENVRVGEYVFEEIDVGQHLYISTACKNVRIVGHSGMVRTADPENRYKLTTADLRLLKKDKYADRTNHGNQTLEGAVYELHAANTITMGQETIFNPGDLVFTTFTDKDGYAHFVPFEKTINGVTKQFIGIPVGEYYWVETVPSRGFLLNPEHIALTITDDTDKYDPTLTFNVCETEEAEVLGRGFVVKMNQDDSNTPGVNDTNKDPAVGAVLRLTCLNNPKEYYDAEIQEDGTCVFVDKEFAAQHPQEEYTIPFGDYEISEVRESNAGEHSYFYLNTQKVSITQDKKEYYFIVIDETFETYLSICKIDQDTGHQVHIAGGQYKIWDAKAGQFLTQMVYPSGNYTDVFVANDNGTLVTAEKITPGDYVVYEVESPKGYGLDKKNRIPVNAADIGKVGGVPVHIDKLVAGVADNIQYKDKRDITINANVYDTALKGKIQVYKEGEMLVTAAQDTTKYGETYTPVFEYKGLEGVTYNVYAAEDIKWPDEHGNYYTKNQLVDTFTTGADGYGLSKELYVGKYYVQEVSAPAAYQVDNTKHEVEVKNDDMYTEFTVTSKELKDKMKQLDLQVVKTFDIINYTDNKTVEKTAVIGVYANEDIKNYKGEVVIHKNDMIKYVNVKEGEKPVIEKLPGAKYYVQELETSYPYEVNPNKYEVDLAYGTQNHSIIATPEVKNTYEKAQMSLIKVSSSTQDNIVMVGDQIDTSKLDEVTAKILDDIRELTLDQVREYVENNDLKVVPGAEFSIYTDAECTKPLYIVNEDGTVGAQAKFVTDESGLVTVEELPLGVYYVKETVAPKGYELSKTVTKVTLTIDSKNQLIYAVLVDNASIAPVITKMDIFTSELIPNCEFEIAVDETKEVLLHATTNEKGIAYIPLDIFEDGVVYTYTEKKAPDMYDIDKEPHQFTAKFDENGEWASEPIKVYNIRKYSKVKLIKTDDEGNLVPNCVFELKSEETDFYEKGVTDENGIYVFENVPYGKYTYTELEAPAKYNIDTTPHEIMVYKDYMEINFVNTGDIAVYAISAVALVSVLGIAFVLRKKLVK